VIGQIETLNGLGREMANYGFRRWGGLRGRLFPNLCPNRGRFGGRDLNRRRWGGGAFRRLNL
jgi:hypothetical protein